MGDKSAIEWTDATWNPVTGCSKVSPGCAHCYAETLSLRFGRSKKPWTPENAAENVVLHPDRLEQPLRWRRPRMIFVNSMSDLFHELVPDDFKRRVFDVMADTPQHTYQVLTKRPAEAQSFLGLYYDRPAPWGHSTDPPLPNVWIGVSIENPRFTWRADVLREIPAAVRFISAEPLLGSLVSVPESWCRKCDHTMSGHGPGGCDTEVSDYGQLDCACTEVGPKPLDLNGIDWLIVGGESGPGARPMQLEWARELRDACARAGVAFFFKQWGGRTPKAGGRDLAGRTWDEMPQSTLAPSGRVASVMPGAPETAGEPHG